jgi:hypothetical protein
MKEKFFEKGRKIGLSENTLEGVWSTIEKSRMVINEHSVACEKLEGYSHSEKMALRSMVAEGGTEYTPSQLDIHIEVLNCIRHGNEEKILDLLGKIIHEKA